jgi:hypothetical protein
MPMPNEAGTARWRGRIGGRVGEETNTARPVSSPKPTASDRSFVNRLLRITLLAPDIQEAILEGRQPKGMQLEELTSDAERLERVENSTAVFEPPPLVGQR